MREVLGVDACAILLLDERRNELVATAAAGLEEEVEAAVRIPVGRGFAGRVAADIQPVVVSDVDRADVYNPSSGRKGSNRCSARRCSRVAGCSASSTSARSPPRTFTADEADLLQNAAERAALGLERAMVYERLIELDRIGIASCGSRRTSCVPHGRGARQRLTLHARAGALAPDEEEALRTILAEQAQLARDGGRPAARSLGLETRAVEIRRERRSVRDLVERALVELSPDEREEASRSTSIPGSRSTRTLQSRRIVSNLVANALRRGAPPIVVTAGRTDGELELVVEDGGAGVPEDVRARLFDEFVRSAESATTWQRSPASPSRGRMRTPRAATCSSTVRATAAHASLRPARDGSRGVGPQSVSILLLAFPVIDRRSRPPRT